MGCWAVLGHAAFSFLVFSTSVSRPTKKILSFFDFKHHHSTHPDGPAFCGCSVTSKSMGKHENPYENRSHSWVWWCRTRGMVHQTGPMDPKSHQGTYLTTPGPHTSTQTWPHLASEGALQATLLYLKCIGPQAAGPYETGELSTSFVCASVSFGSQKARPSGIES